MYKTLSTMMTADETFATIARDPLSQKEYSVCGEMFFHPYTKQNLFLFQRRSHLEGMVATVRVRYHAVDEEEDEQTAMIHYDPVNERFTDQEGLTHLTTKEDYPIPLHMMGRNGMETLRLVLKERNTAWHSALEEALQAPQLVRSCMEHFLKMHFA
jgi:hypothetical protein